MRNLEYCKENPDTFLSEIGNALKKPNISIYKRIENILLMKYGEFSKNHESLEKIKPLWDSRNTTNANEFDLTYNLYSRQKGSVNRFWENMKNANGGKKYKCPLCGINDVTDIDHYMPRSIFPEYSVHLLNLIPLCHTCNNKKRDIWLSGRGKRLIFNAYFDELVKDDILICEITIDNNNMPVANVVLNDSIERTEQTILVTRTIKKMDYIGIYNDKVNDLLAGETLRIKEQLFTRDVDCTKEWEHLKKVYTNMIEHTNIYNEAEILLFKGLVMSSDFENWIQLH